MVTVRFACEHELKVGDNPAATPQCSCGEKRVTRVHAPPPRFSGACSGPYAVMKAVTPAVVNLASAGPLRLKELD